MQQVVIVTGASSGFGKAIAERLATAGHRVYGLCRREVEHPTVSYLTCDVRSPQAVQAAVETVMQREGRVDVLVNNAGMGIGGALELATPEEIDLQMGTNFMGCVNMCQAVLPYMRSQGRGRIVNISSIGGVMGLPYQGFYSASKFAVEGFSEALAAEVRGFGISVSLVEPGDFATGFTASRRNSQGTMTHEAYAESFKRSLGLIEQEENGGGKPEQVACVVERIVRSRHPRMRYVVSNLEQWLSVAIKRVLPGRWFVGILRSYYKV